MADSETRRTVLLIITLDTKSDEGRYLKERIREDGLEVLVLDSGILGEPRGIVPDIPAAETARAAGTSLEELRKKGSRGAAVEEMLKGVRTLTLKLYEEGRIHGAISLGGAEGGVMAASAMQVLPPRVSEDHHHPSGQRPPPVRTVYRHPRYHGDAFVDRYRRDQ